MDFRNGADFLRLFDENLKAREGADRKEVVHTILRFDNNLELGDTLTIQPAELRELADKNNVRLHFQKNKDEA